MDRDAAARLVRAEGAAQGLGIELSFEEGEELRTEVCAKFTADGIRAELEPKRLRRRPASTAREAGEFLLTLAHPYC